MCCPFFSFVFAKLQCRHGHLCTSSHSPTPLQGSLPVPSVETDMPEALFPASFATKQARWCNPDQVSKLGKPLGKSFLPLWWKGEHMGRRPLLLWNCYVGMWHLRLAQHLDIMKAKPRWDTVINNKKLLAILCFSCHLTLKTLGISYRRAAGASSVFVLLSRSSSRAVHVVTFGKSPKGVGWLPRKPTLIKGMWPSAPPPNPQGKERGWRLSSVVNGQWFNQPCLCKLEASKTQKDRVQIASGLVNQKAPPSLEGGATLTPWCQKLLGSGPSCPESCVSPHLRVSSVL